MQPRKYKDTQQHSIRPSVVVKDAKAALSYYSQVFGATELFHLTSRGAAGSWDLVISHMELKVGDSIIVLSEEASWANRKAFTGESSGASHVWIELYVDDVDEVRRRAVAAGARSATSPVDLHAFGERECRLVDPFGVVWIVATRKEDVAAAERQRRLDRMGRVLREPPPLRFDDV